MDSLCEVVFLLIIYLFHTILQKKECYMSELDRKMQALQIEATTLSAQIIVLQVCGKIVEEILELLHI